MTTCRKKYERTTTSPTEPWAFFDSWFQNVSDFFMRFLSFHPPDSPWPHTVDAVDSNTRLVPPGLPFYNGFIGGAWWIPFVVLAILAERCGKLQCFFEDTKWLFHHRANTFRNHSVPSASRKGHEPPLPGLGPLQEPNGQMKTQVMTFKNATNNIK